MTALLVTRGQHTALLGPCQAGGCVGCTAGRSQAGQEQAEPWWEVPFSQAGWLGNSHGHANVVTAGDFT